MARTIISTDSPADVPAEILKRETGLKTVTACV